MATIKLDKIEIHSFHGAFKTEKKLRQKFLVSVSFDYDILPAALSDDLKDTIDYTKIIDIVSSVMNVKTSLIERLIHKIALEMKQSLPGISNIIVSIEKAEVQLSKKLKSVSITDRFD